MPKNTRISEKTIQNPEFINLQPLDINPLMSACDVKVLYIGQNRNGSYIDKATATEMSKTLRGCPIAGWFIEEKDDFGDHGEQLVIDGKGARFNKLTRPYGFVPPESKVWFQFFEDTDEFGNTCLREYLMCQAYLWTGQFPECANVIENSNPQSMELDKDSLKGHWATDNNTGMEFFIINDAIFSQLCILGDDVEPCFEGSQFLQSSNFSLDGDFVKELYSMMKELTYALKNQEGGTSMDPNVENVTNEFSEAEVVENAEVEAAVEQTPAENFDNNQGEIEQSSVVENENNIEDFAKNEKEEDEKKNEAEKPDEENKDEEPAKEENDEDKKEKEPKKDHALVAVELQEQLDKLQEEFSLLQAENAELKAFKKEVEGKQKDDLIASFYMLSDADKEEVIKNKDNYSLDDIEKELSVICVRKKVNFSLNDSSEEQTADVTVNFTEVASTLPPWLRAVENAEKSLNN